MMRANKLSFDCFQFKQFEDGVSEKQFGEMEIGVGSNLNLNSNQSMNVNKIEVSQQILTFLLNFRFYVLQRKSQLLMDLF